MTKNLILLLALLAAVVPAAATEYLVNGNFEQPIDVGWDTVALNLAGVDTFTWSDTLGQPTPGYAVAVHKCLASYASLSQTVDVPDANLALTFDGRFSIGGGSSTCWPAAAMIVHYSDASGTSLGNTCIYLHNQYCAWASSDTQSLIDVTTPDTWSPYSLNIRTELANHLPGINPANVAKITVDIYAYDNGT
jgi:uncharacterized protein (DUF779 family)